MSHLFVQDSLLPHINSKLIYFMSLEIIKSTHWLGANTRESGTSVSEKVAFYISRTRFRSFAVCAYKVADLEATDQWVTVNSQLWSMIEPLELRLETNSPTSNCTVVIVDG